MIARTAAWLVLAIAASTALAQRPAEVHGSLDAYAGEGVAIAWAVLRGRDERSTEVVVRVDADRARYASLAVVGVDPFTRASQPLAEWRPLDGSAEVRIPRARFADLPRSEWRFYARGNDAAPSLVVFYQGVPDTTPEFNDAARMSADLADRIERARRDAKGRP